MESPTLKCATISIVDLLSSLIVNTSKLSHLFALKCFRYGTSKPRNLSNLESDESGKLLQCGQLLVFFSRGEQTYLDAGWGTRREQGTICVRFACSPHNLKLHQSRGRKTKLALEICECKLWFDVLIPVLYFAWKWHGKYGLWAFFSLTFTFPLFRRITMWW